MLLRRMTSWKRFKRLLVLLVVGMLYLVVLQHSVVHLSVSDSLSPPDVGQIRRQQLAPTCAHLTKSSSSSSSSDRHRRGLSEVDDRQQTETATSVVGGHVDVDRMKTWPNSTSRRPHQTDGLMRMMMMMTMAMMAPSADDGRLTFNCSNVDQIRIRHKLGRGVTKQVYMGTVDSTLVAVKMVTTPCWTSSTVSRVRGQGSGRSRRRCATPSPT